MARFVLTRDRMDRWDGYEKLFACGIAGFALAGLTLPIAKLAGDAMEIRLEDVGTWTVVGVLGIPVGFLLASLFNVWRG